MATSEILNLKSEFPLPGSPCPLPGVWPINGTLGSFTAAWHTRVWRNRQTRKIQVLVAARSWRFKSSHPHFWKNRLPTAASGGFSFALTASPRLCEARVERLGRTSAPDPEILRPRLQPGTKPPGGSASEPCKGGLPRKAQLSDLARQEPRVHFVPGGKPGKEIRTLGTRH